METNALMGMNVAQLIVDGIKVLDLLELYFYICIETNLECNARYEPGGSGGHRQRLSSTGLIELKVYTRNYQC